MIEDCSLGSTQSLILTSRLRTAPASWRATSTPYCLRRRATASAIFGFGFKFCECFERYLTYLMLFSIAPIFNLLISYLFALLLFTNSLSCILGSHQIIAALAKVTHIYAFLNESTHWICYRQLADELYMGKKCLCRKLCFTLAWPMLEPVYSNEFLLLIFSGA